MLKKRSIRVIEFYGAPGAGKSYLAKGLLEYSEALGVPLVGRAVKINAAPTLSRVLSKLIYIGPLIAKNPKIPFLIIQFLLDARQSQGRFLVFLNWLYVIACVKKHSHGETVILDQGLLQAYWSMVYRGAKLDRSKFRNFILRLLDHCGVDELKVIDVVMAKPLHLAQLASRSDGRSPLDNGDPSKLEHGLQVTETVRSVVWWLSRSLSSRFSVIKKVNRGTPGCEDLYQELVMGTPTPPP